MKNTEEIIKLYIKDFDEIGKAGKKDRLPDKKIELLQEKYFTFLICSFYKSVSIPNKIKLKIHEEIRAKLEKGRL